MAEVSRYTQMPPSTIRSWFRGRPDRSGKGPILHSDYAPVDESWAYSFHDMIDALVAGHLRKSGVTMRIVRLAHQVLQQDLGTPHPFCHNNIYTDGVKVFLWTAVELDEPTLRDVVSRQQFFAHVRKDLRHIDYSDTTRLARRWRIMNGVVVDPAISFGKPVVERTGVTTFVLAGQYHANEGDTDLVANLYGVEKRNVLDAVAFEARFGRRRAA